MRAYIQRDISIDGRNIPYSIVTARDYMIEKYNIAEDRLDTWIEEKDNYQIYTKINQILAIKQSCYLLRRVSYSCGSLSDDLYSLKLSLIKELKNEYDFEFDDDFVEENVLTTGIYR